MPRFFSFILLCLALVQCKSKKSSETKLVPDTEVKQVVEDTTGLRKSNSSAPSLNKVGNLYLEMSDTAVRRELGEPASKSKAEEWGADGLMHQDWNYPSKGLVLNMASEDKAMQKASVFSISLTDPSPFVTDQNLGIGAGYERVRKTYEKWIDQTQTDSTTIVVGSIYGGMIFNFTGGRVTKMFIGAAAE